jgi:hypothetical protein
MLESGRRGESAWLPPAEEARGVWTALTAEQAVEAEAVARRLHGELRSVIGLLPPPMRGASALARELGVDRATCQRVVRVVSEPVPAAAMLVRFPGIDGLRQFMAAMEAHEHVRSARERIAAALAAIGKFETFLDHMGVSQRGLRARLGLDHPRAGGVGGPESRSLREGLFRSAAALTGRWSEAMTDVRIIAPAPGKPALTEAVRLRGWFGHVAAPDAVPLEHGAVAHLQTHGRGKEAPPPFATLEGEPASGDSRGVLMTEFCSRPLPRLISRNAGHRVLYVVDLEGASAASPADVVLATRSNRPDRHPATMDPPVGEMWQLVNFPARRLVFDVYLHEEIARRCTPSAEVHLWGPDVIEHGSSRWSTRIAGAGPRLEVFRAGGATGTPGYRRYGEMMASVFARVGWVQERFVCHRVEVEYPLWRMGYCMAFDFTGHEMGAG